MTISESASSSTQPAGNHAEALQRIIAELSPLQNDDRRRLIETVSTFFGLNFGSSAHPATPTTPPSSRVSSFQFSEEEEIPSPKTFMINKAPKTDIERVACLAYYLAHHRGTPHFKTKDITVLNTESAHRPFSNTAFAVENATKAGLLVPSIKGSKQLSALGERFVEALPDRDAGKEILERIRQPRSGGRKENGHGGRN